MRQAWATSSSEAAFRWASDEVSNRRLRSLEACIHSRDPLLRLPINFYAIIILVHAIVRDSVRVTRYPQTQTPGCLELPTAATGAADRPAATGAGRGELQPMGRRQLLSGPSEIPALAHWVGLWAGGLAGIGNALAPARGREISETSDDQPNHSIRVCCRCVSILRTTATTAVNHHHYNINNHHRHQFPTVRPLLLLPTSSASGTLQLLPKPPCRPPRSCA